MTSATEHRVTSVSAVDANDVELVEALQALRQSALDLEDSCRTRLDAIPVRDRPSGRNLLHYLALRQHDLRDLQRELAARGLSSLGRAEAHVLVTIEPCCATSAPIPALERPGRRPGRRVESCSTVTPSRRSDRCPSRIVFD